VIALFKMQTNNVVTKRNKQNNKGDQNGFNAN
jgi:hypothetical protein